MNQDKPIERIAALLYNATGRHADSTGMYSESWHTLANEEQHKWLAFAGTVVAEITTILTEREPGDLR